jgi:hypothetical protein
MWKVNRICANDLLVVNPKNDIEFQKILTRLGNPGLVPPFQRHLLLQHEQKSR